MKNITTEKLNRWYILLNAIVVIVSFICFMILITQPASAQNTIVSPEDLSASLISWLKTGMTVVFLLTLLFGAHNMWLHSKFTTFKEETIKVIREEFKPKLADIESNMAKREALEEWKALQKEMLDRILKELEENSRKTNEAIGKLNSASVKMDTLTNIVEKKL